MICDVGDVDDGGVDIVYAMRTVAKTTQNDLRPTVCPGDGANDVADSGDVVTDRCRW